jgi:4-hydroxy-tetrahydrodipicolinate synthase
VLDIARDEVGGRLPIVNGVWADGSLEAARIARMAEKGGAAALLVFPPAPFALGQSPAMAVEHFKRIADASALPIIAFQYPLATGQGYPRETLLKLVEEVPSIRAIKDRRATCRSTKCMFGSCRAASRRSTCSPPIVPGC